MMSAARQISNPPPRAGPSTATIHGLARTESIKPAKPLSSGRSSWIRPAETTFRSAPAQNIPGAFEVRTTTRISGSASIFWTAALSALAVSPSIALRAWGRLKRSSAMCLSTTSNSSGAIA